MKKIILLVLFLGVTLPAYGVRWEAGVYFYSDGCPKDKPFKKEGGISFTILDEDGIAKEEIVCTNCEEETVLKIKYGHEQDFEICSNRVSFSDFSFQKGAFSFKKIECSGDKPLFAVNAAMERFCVSCDSDIAVTSATERECNRCSNRIYEDGFCVLKNKPLGGGSCDFPLQVKVPPKRCGLCPEREYKNGYCVLKVCPEKTFRNEKGGCVDCESYGLGPEFVETSAEECAKCPNRKYYDATKLCTPLSERKVRVYSRIIEVKE